MNLAENLIKAYKVSNPVAFAETDGRAAVEWAEKIINKLKETENAIALQEAQSQDAITSNEWEETEEFAEPWLVFSEMPDDAVPITDRNALHLLRSIIESVYVAGITAIKYAYVDKQDNIRCGFEDRISPSRTLSFDCKINQNQISYGTSEIAASEPVWEQETLSFAAGPTPTKKLNCTPGKSFQCGNSCQKIGRNCNKNPSPAQQQAIATITQTTKISDTPARDSTRQRATPQPSSEVKADGADNFVVTKQLENRRKKLVKHYGEQLIADVESKLKDTLSEADVFIRVPSDDILQKIIGARFKSQFETKRSSAAFDPKLRSDSENGLFGYEKGNKTDPADRPIYAYAARRSAVQDGENPQFSTVDMYGSIAVKLKKEVKSRTTFTGDDSLSGKPPAYMQRQPSTLDNPSVASVLELRESAYKSEEMKKKLQNIADSKNLGDAAKALDSNYIEAQVHGKVRPEDIGELIYLHNKKPSQEIIAWAKTNNVKISYK